MRSNSLLQILNFVLLLGLIGYVVYDKNKTKSAYILNQEVFNQFKGKQELERKLNEIKLANKKRTDSLQNLLSISQRPELINEYHQQLQYIQLTEQQLSDQYTADIWKRINQYVKDFGEEKGYDFVFGATGSGGIMYAPDANNITKEIIEYINYRYEDG